MFDSVITSYPAEAPAIGVSWSPNIKGFLSTQAPGIVDYVEIPFEQLQHSPNLAAEFTSVPVILHCASMSVAGYVRPDLSTLDNIAKQATTTKTPWIGEHLAYVLAAPLEEGECSHPVNVGYTVCPPLNEPTLRQVVANMQWLKHQFSVPIILENVPQYFPVPGSTMSVVEFIKELCERTDINLLLDLAHFYIVAQNFNFNALDAIKLLPLDRVVEIHIAGFSQQCQRFWDDHGSMPPDDIYRLLEVALEYARPRAITLEYNWEANLNPEVMLAQIDKIKRYANVDEGVAV